MPIPGLAVPQTFIFQLRAVVAIYHRLSQGEFLSNSTFTDAAVAGQRFTRE